MSHPARDRQDRCMLAATAGVVALGIADSINPVTILVALYLASTSDPARRLAAFVAGVFAVYFLGGLLIMLGPGELVADALDNVKIPGEDAAALAAGVALIVVAVALWRGRRRLPGAQLPEAFTKPGSAFVLGAVVTGLDLPTAFPYFGAIGLIVAADVPIVAQLLLLAVFNVLYILPLALILCARIVLGSRAHSALARASSALERLAAPLLAAGAGAMGAALAIRGVQAVLG
jgi:cytochrome c biogenesis protein CcdA